VVAPRSMPDDTVLVWGMELSADARVIVFRASPIL
jgi:hypothetical protein